MEWCKRIVENRTINGHVCILRNTGTFVFDAESKFKDFSIEVTVQEIKEIRIVNNCHLEIFYGNDFLLERILLECNCDTDRESLKTKLEVEIEALNNSSYETNFERMIRRKINSINNVYDTNDESRIKIQGAKYLFQEIDLRVTDQQITALFYGSTLNSEISVIELIKFISEEMFKKQENILWKRLDDSPSLKGEYINPENQIKFTSFRTFLYEKQGEDSHLLKGKRCDLLNRFVMDVENDFITPSEFLNHLFSDQNSIRDNNVPQDMSKPLSEYFIASSHNTYLTGNQLTSESSEEAYSRVLRQGCRCIELDCWPEQGKIKITHGFTATSQISFESVLKTIKRHAFETTKYPLILSIENHCPVELQREMARLFINIFGEMLLTAPVNENETELPSPNDLKNRIILKFKKITKEDLISRKLSDPDFGLEKEENEEHVDGISRRGYLWVKASPNMEWESKLFSIFENSLIFYETEELYEDEENSRSFSHEIWYHGTLSLEKVNEIIIPEDDSKIKDGIFFVTNILDHSGYEHLYLFVWKDGVPYDLPITCYLNDRNEQMFEINSTPFKSLEELINYCKLYSLQIKINKELDNDFLNESYQLEIKLTSPMYQLNDHTKMEWYHPSLTREDCNKAMQIINVKGSFLVRNSESAQGNFTLVFCSASNVIRRIIIKRGVNCFKIDNFERSFRSIINLVEFLQFNKSRIYLSYPVTRKQIEEALRSNENSTETIYSLENAELLSEPFKVLITEYTEIWSFRLNFSSKEHILLGCKEYNQAKLWITSIQEVIDNSKQETETSERRYKVAREMSDITVYFQKGDFNKAFYSEDGKGVYNEVFSFEEDNMSSLCYYHPQKIVDFHKLSITRIYPKGTRVTSNNFNPLPFWVYGCQMVALNYQTGDLAMQLNTAWFEQNNNCGYVLRPHCMEDTSKEPIQLEITALGARVMCKDDKWRVTPIFLDTEIHGIRHDQQCYTTELDGGLLCLSLKNSQPEKHVIIIELSEFALLQFTLYAKSRSNTIGQYTIHVNDIKDKGYRSIPLKDNKSEPFFFSSILVCIRKWKKIELVQKISKLKANLRNRVGSSEHHRKWTKDLEKKEKILARLKEASKKMKKQK